MALATTSTGALTSGQSGTLALTNPSVNAGTASMPIIVGAVNGAVAGIYITPSVDCTMRFQLQRQPAGMQGYQGGTPGQNQPIVAGDYTSALQIASTTAAASVTLIAGQSGSGSFTMSVVQ